MTLLILKAILTPLLIAAATLAVRRWGFMVGGLATGLPLTSGPISLFLALEQGPRFTRIVTESMLLGMVAFASFCVVYAWTARGRRWMPPLGIGYLAYLAAAWSLSFVSIPPIYLSPSVFLVLWITLRAAGSSMPGEEHIAAPWWDIPARMVTATALVFLITSGAHVLGPQWSGLITPIPVFTCIMAIFAQKQNGAAAVRRLLRGSIAGCFSSAAFLAVVGFTIEHTSLLAAYLSATGAALFVSGLSLACIHVKSSRSKVFTEYAKVRHR